MTAATFDHQVGKSLEFFEQQRNEKTACARFIGALYFEARAESRMRLEADTASAQTESRPKPARLDRELREVPLLVANAGEFDFLRNRRRIDRRNL